MRLNGPLATYIETGIEHNLILPSNLGSSLEYFQLHLCILCPETLELSLAELSYWIFISHSNDFVVHKQKCPVQLE